MDEETAKRLDKLDRKFQVKKAETLEWARYRWEFMRHNRKVKEAYQEALDLRARAKYQPGTIKKEGLVTTDLYASTPEYQHEQQLIKKMEIPITCGLFPDPSKSFEELFGKNQNFQNFIVAINEHKSAVKFKVKYSDETKVSIEIDFSKVNSVEDLKKYICDNIDVHHTHFGQRRKNSTDYDKILRIGELKRQGLTCKQIAEIEYKNDQDPRNAEDKVYKLFKKYEDIVNGGYLNLRYP